MGYVGAYSTESWLKHTWLFCNEYNVKVKTGDVRLRLRCQGDQFLMDAFLANKYPSLVWKHINQCRLFLWVYCISHVVSADEKTGAVVFVW